MKPVCPFVKVARPDEASSKKSTDKHAVEEADGKPTVSPKCPFASSKQSTDKYGVEEADGKPTVSPKCPFGYDSQTFKLGPLSCLICQALLFDTSRCVPCSHVFCKVCISRFNDCPLCGADIDKIESDKNLQDVVDRFIEGHARIKRSQVDSDKEGEVRENKMVIYEDVSFERGSFLLQQAMRAFRAQNFESAKSRLSLCAEDIRGEIETTGSTSELCSQLGAVLGMLGDCCRAMGDAGSAVIYFEESVEFLGKLPRDDMEITHTLSVSLNKIGDLKYYDGQLEAARDYYVRSLNIRRDVMKRLPTVPSQILDVAVSLAKVADADKVVGNEDTALDRFHEAIQLLESLTLKAEETSLEQRRLSVLDFLKSQIEEKEKQNTAA
ncbi:hypothetical protein K2173_009643 [Erythroxylum novogranatense]|uniref:RING-type domain-containing protein n=1 Tax=Erythroxylum novogranatense TaxID=1862640 RepID=A0AAV8U4H8_9ROSI|nr:hypothetical protein K2173_009643 [Erythroxylum novogranatense]